MFDYIGVELIKILSEPENVIFKKDNSFEFYLSNKELEELIFINHLYLLTNGRHDWEIYHENKEDAIRELSNLLEETINVIYPYFDDKTITGIEELIKNDGVLKEGDSFSFKSLMMLSKFNLLFLFIDDNKTMLHCPKEVLKIFKNIYESKKLKSNKIYNNINSFVTSVIEIYRAVELTELHLMYKKYFDYVSFKKFYTTILKYKLIEDYLNIVPLKDLGIYCGIGTEEEIINNLYNINQDYEYREFSKKEIKSIMERTYIFELPATKELIKFLHDNFDIPKKEVNEFISTAVNNYIDLTEENDPMVGESLIKMIEENFDLDFTNRNIFINLVKKIYNQYPKAKYKGHTHPKK